LGRGSFGKVYELEDVDSGNRVALKIAKATQNTPASKRLAENFLQIE